MVFLLLFSYVILCDLFPLYQFSTDVCLPAKEPIQRERDADDVRLTASVGNHTVLGKNDNKSVEYGFEQHARPSITELILVVWIFTLLCEEIRQVCW